VSRIQQLEPEILVIDDEFVQGDISHFFPIFASRTSWKIPLVSFLFDILALQTIRELLVFTGIITANLTLPPTKLGGKFTLKDIKQLFDLITSIAVGCIALQISDGTPGTPMLIPISPSSPAQNSNPLLRISQLLAKMADLIGNSFAENLQFSSVATMEEVDALFRSLDLHAPGEKITTFWFREKNQEGDSSIAWRDFITRANYNTRPDPPFKKCLRCGRVAAGGKATAGLAVWRDRWSVACPICCGKWQMIQ